MVPRTMNDSLGELEQLLEEETVALRKLDQDAIDRIAVSKAEWCERTTRAAASDGARCRSESEHARLERIRHRALHNQVLLVHARDAVRGVLSLLTGETHVPGRSPGSDGLRLSVRG